MEIIQEHLRTVGRARGLLDETVRVSARALSPEEAIGNPEHDDYPLVIGRERMMEAIVRGVRGQAFTDMYGRWKGRFRDVCEMEPATRFRRAIIVATLNALMQFAGEVTGTIHCRDEGPVRCAERLPAYLESEGLEPPFALIGYQPRLAEALASAGELRITDMDVRNIGQVRAGVRVRAPTETDAALAGAGSALVTGSTIVNGTLGRFAGLDTPTAFYGVTIVGAARLLGLRHYCPAESVSEAPAAGRSEESMR